jgi:Homeodomain-like domain
MPRPNAPRVDAALRDAQALELRAAGASYRQIADRLGISVSTAHGCVERGLDRTRREPADHLRRLEAERLDRLQVEAVQVLRAQHVVIQAGQPVVDTDTGRPYVDHGPTLAAIRTLLAVAERRAKLEGLDAPSKVDVRGTFTVDLIDARIAELTALLGADDSDGMVRQQRQRDREQQFRSRWSTPGAVARDPAGFVGNALELGLQLLNLDDQEREAAGLDVETLLLGRVHP